jgi:hypothetical protein
MVYKILYLYPDLLDLYGDSGNIEVLKYRLKQRGIECVVDTYSIFEDRPNFCDYNLIFMGGGADREQSILSDDLAKYKDDIIKAIDNGVFVLLICGGFQLFGKYYKDADGNVIDGLGIFDYYTVSGGKRNRNIGNIVIESIIDGKPYKVIGFENHGGITYDINDSFGKILYKNPNNTYDYEGFMLKNVIGTYLHGPLLSKNPVLADYIIKVGLLKDKKKVSLEPINDDLENKCRDVLISKFL